MGVRTRPYIAESGTMHIRIWVALSCLSLALTSSSSRADEPIPLKILYAGHPGTPRERDFVEFLKAHFTRVESMSYEEFKESDAQGRDVVILDWTSTYPVDKDGNDVDMQKVGVEAWSKMMYALRPRTIPQLSESYDRPTILVGEAGGYILNRMRLKLDWR